MFLTVRLAQDEKDVLVVPEEALVQEQGNVFVFVVQDTRVAKRKIRTGQRRVGTVEVLEGLQSGELVVTEGTQKLRDGASVRLVDGGATPGNAATAERAARP
jgi:membrane fusion protein (multidrug efflux system)